MDEIRVHDICSDPLDAEFVIVHARLVPEHLPDRLDVLDILVAAPCPGGWLLIEDADLTAWLHLPSTRLFAVPARFTAMGGSTPSRAADGAVTAFQADSYDPQDRSGWTAIAIGWALHIRDAETLGQSELDEKLPEPWEMGKSAERYFRIDLSGVSGTGSSEYGCSTTGWASAPRSR